MACSGSGAKGRRQLVDSRALAAKPGRQEEQDAKARAEARARQRAAMQARQEPVKVAPLLWHAPSGVAVRMVYIVAVGITGPLPQTWGTTSH